MVLEQPDNYVERSELRSIRHMLHIKLNLKWILGLSVKAKMVKFLKDNIRDVFMAFDSLQKALTMKKNSVEFHLKNVKCLLIS